MAIDLLGLASAGTALVVAVLVGDVQAIIQVAVVVAFVGVRTVRWWFLTFTVTETHIEVHEGVLRRRHRVLPYSRIQQVDVNQGLLHRIAGVAALRLETAGEGGATAISLRLLERAEADGLRAFVLDRRDRAAASGGSPGTAAPSSAPAAPVLPGGGRAYVPVLEVSPARLFLAGITDAGAVFSTLLIVPFAVGLIVAGIVDETALDGDDAGLTTGGLTLLAFPLLSLVVAVIAGVVRVFQDWGYRMVLVGDDLHVRRGLVQVSEQTIPRRRVQEVAVVDDPIRRMVGMVTVLLHSAAPAHEEEGRGNDVRIPLILERELQATLLAVAGDRWVVPPLRGRGPAARRRAVVRRCLLLLLVFGWTIVLAPLALVGIPWGRAAHRRAGMGESDEMVAFASGVLRHRLDLVPRDRIQSVRTSASPFQRRVGLRTLWVDVAGSRIAGPFTRAPHIHDLEDGEAASALRRLATPGRSLRSRHFEAPLDAADRL